MQALIAIRLLVPLALVFGVPVSALAQAAETHTGWTCEIDTGELTDADRQRLPPELRNQSFLTPVDPDRGDFTEKKCTFSQPDQTIQIRCVRVVENVADAPSFTTKDFTCIIRGDPQCGGRDIFPEPFVADNQTFKSSPNGDGTAAILELFCVRNKR